MRSTIHGPAYRENERGIALALSLILMLMMSVLAVSLMFVSQTETYASMNYRMMSQARYGAESGVHKTINYLLNTYAAPGTVGDPLSNYDMTTLPVQYGGRAVVLSANSGVASNYPIASVQTAFNDAAQGTLAVGNGSVQYAASATLLSMQVVNGQTVMSWQITSDGTIGGARPATVEVTSVLEKQLIPHANAIYGAFAVSGVCGALTWNNAPTDSYDSTLPLVDGRPEILYSNGNVGTNGNMAANGSSSQIHGSLSTPRIGVGSCSEGNALTSSGGASVSGGIIQLSQAVSVPTPLLPDPAPPPDQDISVTDVSNCPVDVTGCTRNVDGSKTFAPGSYGNITLIALAHMHVTAGTYNINSLNGAFRSQIIIDSSPVIIHIVGAQSGGGGGLSTPFVLNSALSTDPARPYDATQLQIDYAGTGTVTMANQTTFVGQINAPNANVIISSDYYGSIIGSKVTMLTLITGSSLHFDRHLTATPTFTVGPDMMTSFTWKKY